MQNTLFKLGKRQITDQMAVTALVLSLFLPFVVSIAVTVAVFFAVLFNPRARSIALSDKRCHLLYIFGGLSVLASIFGGNYLGIICTFGLIAVFTVGEFMLGRVDKDVVGAVVKGISRILPFVTAAAVIEFCIRFYFVQIADQKIRFMMRCVCFFFNPNYFGAVMAATALIFICLFLKEKEHRLNHFLSGLMALVCLLLSQSLLSCLALLLGAVVLLIVSKKWGWLVLVAALLAMLTAAIILFPQYIPRLDEVTETYTLRLRIWRVAWEGFKQSVLYGQGPLTYFHICGDYVGKIEGVKVWVTQHAHNIVFDSLLNYGVVGAMFLWAYMGCLIANTLRRLKGSDRFIKGLIFALLVAVGAHGMFDVTIIWVQTGLLFLFVLAIPRKDEWI